MILVNGYLNRQNGITKKHSRNYKFYRANKQKIRYAEHHRTTLSLIFSIQHFVLVVLIATQLCNEEFCTFRVNSQLDWNYEHDVP